MHAIHLQMVGLWAALDQGPGTPSGSESTGSHLRKMAAAGSMEKHKPQQRTLNCTSAHPNLTKEGAFAPAVAASLQHGSKGGCQWFCTHWHRFKIQKWHWAASGHAELDVRPSSAACKPWAQAVPGLHLTRSYLFPDTRSPTVSIERSAVQMAGTRGKLTQRPFGTRPHNLLKCNIYLAYL